MTDASIETLGDLLTLMTKPVAFKAKLAELRKTIDKAEKATAKLEAAGQVDAARLAADRTEMETREQSVRDREVKVMLAERDLQARAARLEEAGRPWRPERVETLPNGLTRELS